MKLLQRDSWIVHAAMAVASILWTIVFWKFFSRDISLFPDGASYFNWTRYYFDNIAQGVYPLWQPMDNWGYPVGFKLRFLGEFNPFLWGSFVAYRLGMPYHIAYFSYAVGYFLIGIYGFYLITRHLLKNQYLAGFAFILLLFSNLGIAIFFNYCEVALLVPGIWFFYFWLRFFNRPSKFSFLGMTFALMLILTTYMPFYFLTIFLTYLVAVLILNAKEVIEGGTRLLQFMNLNRILVLICIFLVGVSAMPGYVTYRETGSSEFSYEHRQADSEESAVTTGISMVNAGSIIGPLTLKGLFSGLRYQENYLSYYFLPIIVYPILLLTAFCRMRRRMIVYLMVILIMFLITCTSATGVLGYLYDRVFFFKIMRNIFYLFYLVVPFMVLFIVEQMKLWLDQCSSQRVGLRAWTICVFLGMMVFLYWIDDVLVSSFVSVVIFTAILISNLHKSHRAIFWMGIYVISIVQPVIVYRLYVQNVSNPIEQKNKVRHRHTQFFFERPKFGQKRNFERDVFPDSSGYMTKKFAGTQRSAWLQKNAPVDILQNYTRYKFLVYDDVINIDVNNINWIKVVGHLSQLNNPAFIFGDSAQLGMKSLVAKKAKPMLENSNEFRVLQFNMNEIVFETNFENDQFLVYNDSYQSNWRAEINGVSAKIQAANIAFKGLWLEAGKNVVTMRFGSVWLERFYKILIGVFLMVFVVLIIWGRKEHLEIDSNV